MYFGIKNNVSSLHFAYFTPKISQNTHLLSYHINSLEDGMGGASEEVKIQGQMSNKEICRQCQEWSGPQGPKYQLNNQPMDRRTSLFFVSTKWCDKGGDD